MSERDAYSRRHLFVSSGMGLTVALAGCTGDGDDHGQNLLQGKSNRREFITAAGALATAGLAGCADDEPQQEPTNQNGETDTPDPDDENKSDNQEEETKNARNISEMPPAYRIDFRNTGNTNHSVFDYTAENEDGEPYDIEDPAVRELNLEQLDEWYENNWENTKFTELQEFMDKLGNPEISNRDEHPEAMKNAQDYGEFREWFVPIFFTYMNQSDDFGGPISSEADIYLPTVQEAVDRYNDNFDIHAWDFQTEGLSVGHRHGLGQVYDKTNDEMWVFETVDSPRTARDTDLQEAVNGQKIQETPYLQPGTHTYEEGHWHPLRFKDIYENPEEAAPQEMGGFEWAKGRAHDFIIRMAGGPGSGRTPMTNELVIDTLENLSGGSRFDQAYEVAKLAEWCRTEEENYVLSGTADNPEIYRTSENITEEILEDHEGLYDGFETVITEYNSGEYGSWSDAAEAVN